MAFLNAARRMRGLSMLEMVIAMAILTFAVILFGSGMIAATRAESTSAQHTQAIMIGNYLLEQTRTDSSFWSSEWTNPCLSANCWNSNVNSDASGNPLPPYNDALTAPPLSWHAGFNPAGAGNVTLPPYHYIWRADQIDAAKFTGTKAVAAVTIEVYVDQQGPRDVYVVKGMNRLQ